MRKEAYLCDEQADEARTEEERELEELEEFRVEVENAVEMLEKGQK